MYLFIGKADIQRGGETERKILRPVIHSPSERNGRCCANSKPGVSSRSPTRVQGPKAFGCPRLLSRATGKELDGKRGQDSNRRPYGIPGVQGENLNHCTIVPGPICVIFKV